MINSAVLCPISKAEEAKGEITGTVVSIRIPGLSFVCFLANAQGASVAWSIMRVQFILQQSSPARLNMPQTLSEQYI